MRHLTRRHPLATFAVLALAAAACSGDRDEHRAPPRSAVAAQVAGDRARTLLDSASRLLARGDTTAARQALAAANALASSDPALVYRVAAAQEAVGDVGPAARAYRRYLSLAPGGADAARASDRLSVLVAGVDRYTRRAGGETAPPPAGAGLSDPATTGQAARGASPTRSMVASARPATTRRARRSTPARTVAARPAPTTPNAPLAPLAPLAAPTPPRVAVAEPLTEDDPVDAAPATGVTPASRPAPTTKIHYSRWSRMQRWFVAKVAGLGGVGGVVVGAIVGNVPGALAVGVATGAAGGLAKVHQDKVDSARTLKAEALAARVVRDSAAGEVDLLPPADSVRHRGAP